MQLGFDRQHFTLPRVGIFLGLNKGRPSRVRRCSTNPGLAVSSYSNSWSKALLQTNSIWCGLSEGTNTRRSHEAVRLLDTLLCSVESSAGNSVRAIVDTSRCINHVSSRNNFYPFQQQSLTDFAKVRHGIEINSQQKHHILWGYHPQFRQPSWRFAFLRPG